MIFFTLLAALALEHNHPLRPPLLHFQYFAQYAALLHHKLDGGEKAHGLIAWCAAVLPVVLVVWLIQAWLADVGLLLEMAWGVAVLYVTMGLKYFSSTAEAIAGKLRDGQLEAARQDLQDWRGGDAAAFDVREIAAVTIEQLIAHSHRQTFGVLFWFVLLGPAGAVLFRLSSILSLRWREATPEFSSAAASVFHALNWAPQRLTALTYAVAGNFEDAMYCWRSQANGWAESEEGIVLAAGAGAMGVKLGQPLNVGGQWLERCELGLGEEADADHIESANSMIWRGLVIWLAVALLLLIAGWAS